MVVYLNIFVLTKLTKLTSLRWKATRHKLFIGYG
jgi:hypothetical protein